MQDDQTSGGGRKKRYRLRFSLRTLFVLVTLFCIWIGFQARAVHNEARAIAELEGRHFVDVLGGKFGVFELQPRQPAWFWHSIGGRYANTATVVLCHIDKINAALPHISRLSNLRELEIVSYPDRIGDDMEDRDAKLDAAVALAKRSLPGVEVVGYHGGP